MIEFNFIEALGSFLKNLQNKLASKDFSVPASAWTASEDPDFPFTAEISAAGVTVSDSAEVKFNKSTIKAAMTAVVITGETSEGKIALLAEKAPTAALSGVYRIIKGGVE